MKTFVNVIAVGFFGYGLWTHDWKTLLASALTFAIWPLIAHEVMHGAEERRHAELLERLWDDDGDLPYSA